MTRNLPERCICVLILLLSAVTLAFAQSGTSSLRGTVTDPAGAIVPDATITLSSAEIAVNLTTQTDKNGFLPVSSGSSGHIRADGDCDRVRHLQAVRTGAAGFHARYERREAAAGQRDHNGRGAGPRRKPSTRRTRRSAIRSTRGRFWRCRLRGAMPPAS